MDLDASQEEDEVENQEEEDEEAVSKYREEEKEDFSGNEEEEEIYDEKASSDHDIPKGTEPEEQESEQKGQIGCNHDDKREDEFLTPESYSENLEKIRTSRKRKQDEEKNKVPSSSTSSVSRPNPMKEAFGLLSPGALGSIVVEVSLLLADSQRSSKSSFQEDLKGILDGAKATLEVEAESMYTVRLLNHWMEAAVQLQKHHALPAEAQARIASLCSAFEADKCSKNTERELSKRRKQIQMCKRNYDQKDIYKSVVLDLLTPYLSTGDLDADVVDKFVGQVKAHYDTDDQKIMNFMLHREVSAALVDDQSLISKPLSDASPHEAFTAICSFVALSLKTEDETDD